MLLVTALIGLLSYAKFALPNVGAAPEIKVEMTPENIARGENLAKYVFDCIACHSSRDWTKFSGPPIEATFGMGGELFDQKMGFPGSYYASNITPEGISRYTDGELFRVITTGVTKEGKALFPIMPYPYCGQMKSEDLDAIFEFLKTVKPIKNRVEKFTPSFF